MSATMRISLRANERIYINGAVLKVDRKTTVELLNDAVFLLESHVMQAEAATTPLRQLYFALQTLLMEPGNAVAADAFARMHIAMRKTFSSLEIQAGLQRAGELVAGGRIFEALKSLRGLFAMEAEILADKRLPPQQAA